LDILWRPFEVAGRFARSSFQAIMRHRRLRVALLTMLVALPLLAGGWMLLRKSSFTAVEHVKVSGLHGAEARAIETALTGAGRQMSTLDTNTAALRAAVSSFPVVRSVRAIPSFPHSLRIEVTEQLPVAALTIDGARTAVAADGVVLGPALLSSSLPALNGADVSEPPVGQHLKDQSLLAELTVLGATPKRLERFTVRVFSSPGGQGLTVAMRNGLLVYFGDASRPHAKWLSLTRVLADPSSAGASYIDVRLPERPAAGFSSAGATATGSAAGTSTAGQAVTPESTVAALAANLTATTDGEPTPAAGATPTGGSTSTTEAAASTTVEAESSAGSAGSTTAGEAETPAAIAAPGG
jgi:cell division protein FtsQ